MWYSYLLGFSGTKGKYEVEAWGVELDHGEQRDCAITMFRKYKLMLENGVYFSLFNCFNSSNMAHNIIYFHVLYKGGSCFAFDNDNGGSVVYKSGSFIFTASLCNGVYEKFVF